MLFKTSLFLQVFYYFKSIIQLALNIQSILITKNYTNLCFLCVQLVYTTQNNTYTVQHKTTETHNIKNFNLYHKFLKCNVIIRLILKCNVIIILILKCNVYHRIDFKICVI